MLEDLNVKSKNANIAVFDFVAFAFEADLAFFLGGGGRAGGNQILPIDNFNGNETVFEVRVDFARGLRRQSAFGNGPGARFVFAGRQICD